MIQGWKKLNPSLIKNCCLFAILTMMSIIASIMISNPMLLVLTLLFLVLLVPYIMHYYTLENEVQKMYNQYDEILKHLS